MRATEFCPECARPTDDDAHRGDRHFREYNPRREIRPVCPHCGAALGSDEGNRWVNVARVTSLAEAGFLVDELSGEDIAARIYQSEDFSALTDRWMVSYLIQSPPSDAQAAADRIRRHLAEIESYQEPAGSGLWNDERPALDSVMWRPMAMVILAGVASFIVGQRFAALRNPLPPQRNSLAGAVTDIGRPLVTEPAAGLPRHRLYYLRREQAWYLETDADADGCFEASQRFHAAGSRW
jgi:hypothetical protein